MGPDPAEVRHDILERLDLALADRVAAGPGDVVSIAGRRQQKLFQSEDGDDAWIAGTLGLRGLAIGAGDVDDVLSRRGGRFRRRDQEHALIHGMQSVLQIVRSRALRGTAPTGWFLVDLFRVLTTDVPRFRKNTLRGDQPWDAMMHVSYPDAAHLSSILDSFTPARRYRDIPTRFDALHPVRQSFRFLWRFARIAPLPDFNVPMAFVGMNAYLMAKGYPLMSAAPQDREFLTGVINGPPPMRLVQWESRLLRRVESEQD